MDNELRTELEKRLISWPNKINFWDRDLLELLGRIASLCDCIPYGYQSVNESFELRIRFNPKEPGSIIGKWEALFFVINNSGRHIEFKDRIFLEIKANSFNVLKDLVLSFTKSRNCSIVKNAQPIKVKHSSGIKEFYFNKV